MTPDYAHAIQQRLVQHYGVPAPTAAAWVTRHRGLWSQWQAQGIPSDRAARAIYDARTLVGAPLPVANGTSPPSTQRYRGVPIRVERKRDLTTSGGVRWVATVTGGDGRALFAGSSKTSEERAFAKARYFIDRMQAQGRLQASELQANPLGEGWLLPALAVLSASTAVYFFWNSLQAEVPALRPVTPSEPPPFVAPSGPTVLQV